MIRPRLLFRTHEDHTTTTRRINAIKRSAILSTFWKVSVQCHTGHCTATIFCLFLATKALLSIPSSSKSPTPLQHRLVHSSSLSFAALLPITKSNATTSQSSSPPLPSPSRSSRLCILLFPRGARLLLTTALILTALASPISSSSSSDLHQISAMATMDIRKDSAPTSPRQLLIGHNYHYAFHGRRG